MDEIPNLLMSLESMIDLNTILSVYYPFLCFLLDKNPEILFLIESVLRIYLLSEERMIVGTSELSSLGFKMG